MATLTSVRARGNAEYSPWPFESFGDPQDVYVPQDRAGEINKLLQEMTSSNKGFVSMGGFDSLPAVPGLAVGDYGGVSLPLRRCQAKALANMCRRVAPNVWTISARHVELQNPRWRPAIQQLCEQVSRDMGFKTILQPTMSKVVVLGPGARLNRQEDVDPRGKAVAKLMVQFPSEYTGGSMLVFEKDTQDFVTLDLVNRFSCFEPLYVAHGVGREWSVKEVTSGYRVTVEYWLRPLSHAAAAANEGRSNEEIQAELAQSIVDYAEETGHRPHGYSSDDSEEENEDDDGTSKEIIVLMLSTACKASTIESKGIKSLSGLDRARVEALQKANAMADDALKFHIAELYCRVLDDDSQCGEQVESATWYSVGGDKLCRARAIDWTTRTVLLNPEHETLSKVFQKNSSYSGQVFSRFALIGWPESADVENTYHIMGEIAGMVSFLPSKTESSTCMPSFLKTLKLRMFNGYAASQKRRAPKKTTTLEFCQAFCATVIKEADPTLVSVFLTTYFPQLKNKDGITSSFAALIEAFGWSTLKAQLKVTLFGLGFYGRVAFSLNVADAMETDSAARKALVLDAWDSARSIPNSRLVSAPFLEQLWKHAVMDEEVFNGVAFYFEQVLGQFVSPALNSLSKHVDASSPLGHRSLLATMAEKRRNWLVSEIDKLTEPFTWKIVDNNFAFADKVISFLNSPEPNLVIQEFAGLKQGRAWIKSVTNKIKAPLSFSGSGRGANAVVEVVKTGGAFVSETSRLSDYQAEKSRLTQLLLDLEGRTGNGPDMRGTKRRRESDAANASTKSSRSM